MDERPWYQLHLDIHERRAEQSILGNKRGTIDQGLLEGRLAIDLEQLAGWHGLTMYSNVFQIQGLQEVVWVFWATSEGWKHACEHLEPQIFLVA
jgi:hypothetical protein